MGCTLYNGICRRKGLKIPKRPSEAVNRRRKDNTMAKRNHPKGQTTINNKNVAS